MSRTAIIYPDSDGRPMAESPVQRDEMMRSIQMLQDAFADRDDVYVSGNMMLYYEEGNPRASVSPDVQVTFGVPRLPERRVYKLWEEAPPAFVLEITSRSTRREDLGRKRTLYQRIGVGEYFLYDPTGDYLRPALQGFRLVEGVYEAIPAEADGALVSNALNMRLLLQDGRLQYVDRRSGARLLDRAERIAMLEAQLRGDTPGSP